jgi:pilus assembly protein Flp/PilA
MLCQTARFLRDETGATAIEYSLIAALVSIAAVGALVGLSDQLRGVFNTIIEALSGAA